MTANRSPLTPARRLLVVLSALALMAAACGGGEPAETHEPVPPQTEEPSVSATPTTTDETKVTLITHDSFALSDGTLAEFTAQTGYEVELLEIGDAGTLVAEAILTKRRPLGDVLFGIDNTFLDRGLYADIFEACEPAALA